MLPMKGKDKNMLTDGGIRLSVIIPALSHDKCAGIHDYHLPSLDDVTSLYDLSHIYLDGTGEELPRLPCQLFEVHGWAVTRAGRAKRGEENIVIDGLLLDFDLDLDLAGYPWRVCRPLHRQLM